jgi:predicted dehydrogenase
VHAKDVAEGTHAAATFDDAVRMHKLLDAALASSQTGRREPVAEDAEYRMARNMR